MSRLARIAVNAPTNYGVMFNAGNMFTFAVQGGQTAVIINGIATLIAFGLALRAELRETAELRSPPLPDAKPESLWDDPRMPILASLLAQAVVGYMAVDKVLSEGGSAWKAMCFAAIPLANAVTNTVAAGLLERAAKGIRRAFNHSAELSVPEKIGTSPDLYFAGSSSVTAGSPWMLVPFGIAGATSLFNKLTGRENTGVVRNPYAWFIGASIASAALNAAVLPMVAGFALFSIGYLSYNAIERRGGMYELFSKRTVT